MKFHLLVLFTLVFNLTVSPLYGNSHSDAHEEVARIIKQNIFPRDSLHSPQIMWGSRKIKGRISKEVRPFLDHNQIETILKEFASSGSNTSRVYNT
jgi:hypothetical protein